MATKKRSRTWPSAEALELSERLQQLSQSKLLKEALDLYRASESIRDSHHACIVLDCCARCGDFETASDIVDKLPTTQISVQVRTALLKGYAHAGCLPQAEALFLIMCKEQANRDKPNVRTLNTLLRGCLWTAASSAVDNDTVCGGVITSERAWNSCEERDASSYEYTVALLCQAQRLEEAESRIQEMPAEDAESIAAAYTSLARGYAVSGNAPKAKGACERAMTSIQEAMDGEVAESNNDISVQDKKKQKRQLSGGKRAWKQHSHGNGSNEVEAGSRARSNVTFRKHRLNEFRDEISSIQAFCKRNSDAVASPRQLARRLLTRLIYISGGGTTKMLDGSSEYHTKMDANQLQQSLVNSAFHSFGLQAALKAIDQSWPPADTGILRRKDCNRILGSVGLQGGIVSNQDGCIDFRKIFSSSIGNDEPREKSIGAKKESNRRRRSGKKAHPVILELGAGFGEWIVGQAHRYEGASFVAVELRADRVSQIASRAAYIGCDNVCVVGADGGAFLDQYVRRGSISTVVVNHPEPPTQVYGSESADLQAVMDGQNTEPGHMLHSPTLLAIAHSLEAKPASKFIVVTDNRNYGRLVCATLCKMSRSNNGNTLWRSEDASGAYSKLSLNESFQASGDSTIHLLEGRPQDAMAHMETFHVKQDDDPVNDSAGRTYFDRLWKTGVGQHAQVTTRYMIIMSRVG